MLYDGFVDEARVGFSVDGRLVGTLWSDAGIGKQRRSEFQEIKHSLIAMVDSLKREKAPAHTALIGKEEEHEPRLPEQGEGFLCAGQEPDLRRTAYVITIEDNGAITVEKHSLIRTHVARWDTGGFT